MSPEFSKIRDFGLWILGRLFGLWGALPTITIYPGKALKLALKLAPKLAVVGPAAKPALKPTPKQALKPAKPALKPAPRAPTGTRGDPSLSLDPAAPDDAGF